MASDGGIFNYGDAKFYGSSGSLQAQQARGGHGGHVDRPWILAVVASDGGIFNYGDAKFNGSTGSIALSTPIVGMVGVGVAPG